MSAMIYRSKGHHPAGGGFGQDADVLLAAMDARLRFVFWSHEAERHTGLPARCILGQSLYEAFPDALGSPAEALYLDVLATARPATLVTELDRLRWELTARKRDDRILLFARRIDEATTEKHFSSGARPGLAQSTAETATR